MPGVLTDDMTQGANHTTQMRPHPRNVANREKKAKDSVIIKR